MDQFKKISLNLNRGNIESHGPKYTAIVLAAGVGSRMNTDIKKQFIELCDIPIVVRSLLAFQENTNISDIVLVTGLEDMEYCMKLCMDYSITKVKEISEGGNTRFRSVYNGLRSIKADTDYVLIHDGARPLVSDALISRCCDLVPGYKACVAAVPVTDTIKSSDKNGYAEETLDRSRLWSVQTPQVFSYPLIMEAYSKLFITINNYGSDESRITDDGVIVESMSSYRVKLILGERKNIKITTREDLVVAEAFINSEL